MSSSNASNIDDENDKLIRALQALSKKDKRLCKSTAYQAPADPTITVHSWKMNEFKYSTIPSPFPTLARGIFTRWVSKNAPDGKPDGEGEGRHAIVARGYDKFFNIGEVLWNTWESFKAHTSGPYYLTLKSNGCIIFIAALTPTKLIVTSKHSVGDRPPGISHASKGEEWLFKHLASKGKSAEDLAARLHKDNLTAVAELCDDSFEEHVLGYPPELTGLHLHGLNHNTGAFSTFSPPVVNNFAAEWGFIQTAYEEIQNIDQVKTYTDECGTTGMWRGQAVEGFVVRCKVAHTPDSSYTAPISDILHDNSKPKDDHHRTSRTDRSHPPYPPGSDFFFKVKFDEPYLMYRAWREITKTILTHKSKADSAKHAPLSIPKSRLARPESRVYKNWVEKEIDQHPEDFEEFSQGHNIIGTRDKFLRWLETPEGKKALKAAGGDGESSEAVENHTRSAQEGGAVQSVPKEQKWGKTVIVPIAVPGSGKTAVAVALTHLFGFAHTQSDDVQAKKTAPGFQKNIADLLRKPDVQVVFADRNNHLAQHRAGIREATDSATQPLPTPKPKPGQKGSKTAAHTAQPAPPEKQDGPPIGPVRLIALDWSVHTLPTATVHRICSDRVLSRGSNHQSLRASAERVKHEDVIWKFLTSGEELGDGEVDDVVEMDIRDDDLERMVQRAVDGLVPLLGLKRPSEQEIHEACDKARGYKTDLRKREQDDGKVKPPRYYGLLAEVDLEKLIDEDAVKTGRLTEKALELWNKLKSDGRIIKRPHVTIVHSKSLPPAPKASADVDSKAENSHPPPDGSQLASKALWDVSALLDKSSSPPLFEYTLGTLVFDDRVMAITVDGLSISTSHPSDTSLHKPFLDALGDTVRQRLHVTVGTRDADVPPVEGGKLVERWKKGDHSIGTVQLAGRTSVGRVKGLN